MREASQEIKGWQTVRVPADLYVYIYIYMYRHLSTYIYIYIYIYTYYNHNVANCATARWFSQHGGFGRPARYVQYSIYYILHTIYYILCTV